MIIIVLISLVFILAIAIIVIAKRPSIPPQSPIGGGWTDDGEVVRLTTQTDNIGIGTNTPAAKVDIIGEIKISDGTEGTGKVLTSDETGLASWQVQPAGDGVSGNGTPNFIPIWATGSSLGDSIMKIDANGNLILKPGSSIIVTNSDSSKCVMISGGSITYIYKFGIPCPSF